MRRRKLETNEETLSRNTHEELLLDNVLLFCTHTRTARYQIIDALSVESEKSRFFYCVVVNSTRSKNRNCHFSRSREGSLLCLSVRGNSIFVRFTESLAISFGRIGECYESSRDGSSKQEFHIPICTLQWIAITSTVYGPRF